MLQPEMTRKHPAQKLEDSIEQRVAETTAQTFSYTTILCTKMRKVSTTSSHAQTALERNLCKSAN